MPDSHLSIGIDQRGKCEKHMLFKILDNCQTEGTGAEGGRSMNPSLALRKRMMTQ